MEEKVKIWCLVDLVMGGCGLTKRRSSPETLRIDEICVFVRISSVERSRQTGQESFFSSQVWVCHDFSIAYFAGCGRASTANSPVLFLMPFISVSHGSVTQPGVMQAGKKPRVGCQRSKSLQRKNC